MRDFAKAFYASKSWHKCRTAYKKSVGGLCERCLKNGVVVPGVIVHHKIRVTPATIAKPEVLLDFNNLELLCRNCHAEEHKRDKARYTVDDEGRVTILCPPNE